LPSKNNYGFLLSLAVHILIVTIPVSLLATRQDFKEIELFVIDERPVIPPPKKEVTRQKRPKEVSREIKEEIEPEVVITQASVQLEPKVVVNTPVTVPMPPPPRHVQPVDTPPPAPPPPRPLIDVEFGSQNAPRFLHREIPVYPLIARRLGKEGRVLLRLTIDERGNLLNVEVIEGAGYGLTEAAVEAVKKSTFTPAMVDGKAVPSKALLPIRFSLRSD